MGLVMAFGILSLWSGHLVFTLEYVLPEPLSPWTYLHMFLQAYLFTGLFITAHDAMHGTVTSRPKLNTVIGLICSFLFAGLSYRRLLLNHHQHHEHPGGSDDPDYSVRWKNPFLWWLTFLIRYTTIAQLVIMAALYNLLMLRYTQAALWLFWIVPAFLGTFQLFYFGTYLPHHRPHTEIMQPHNARSQRRNHLWAMLSCYFFGYHFEHHESPGTPWWKLYEIKQ